MAEEYQDRIMRMAAGIEPRQFSTPRKNYITSVNPQRQWKVTNTGGDNEGTWSGKYTTFGTPQGNISKSIATGPNWYERRSINPSGLGEGHYIGDDQEYFYPIHLTGPQSWGHDPGNQGIVNTSKINLNDIFNRYPGMDMWRLIQNLDRRNIAYSNRGGLMSLV